MTEIYTMDRRSGFVLHNRWRWRRWWCVTGTKKLFFFFLQRRRTKQWCVCVLRDCRRALFTNRWFFFAFFNPSKREWVEFNWIKNIKNRSLPFPAYTYVRVYIIYNPFLYLPAACCLQPARVHTRDRWIGGIIGLSFLLFNYKRMISAGGVHVSARCEQTIRFFDRQFTYNIFYDSIYINMPSSVIHRSPLVSRIKNYSIIWFLVRGRLTQYSSVYFCINDIDPLLCLPRAMCREYILSKLSTVCTRNERF